MSCHKFFILFIFFKFSTSSYYCPPANVLNGICYHIFNDYYSRGWFDAEAFCANDGGQLGNIKDAFINNFVAKIANNGFTYADYWIGGLVDIDKATNRTVWKWIDYNSFNYTNWDSSYSNKSYVGQCLTQNLYTGKWSTSGCDEQKNFVCEYANTSQLCPNWDSMYFITHVTAFGNKCYGISSGVYNWSSALSNCQKFNGSLVSIHSYNEDKLISRLTSGYTFIGLMDPTNNGNNTENFIWSDSRPMDYSNWCLASNSINGSCVLYDSDEGCWYSRSCHEYSTYVCEYYL
uniref:C-type lectin domain-containing protein n=1 Tax=Acrobeloides nanus TaxID=290746 RepID=A0A914D3F0_9BILA